MARLRVRQVFTLCAGFVHTQAMVAIAELGIPAMLRAGPRALDAIARETYVAPARLRVLLDAGCAAGLLRRRRGERYGLAGPGAALVENAGLLAMIRHDALLYDDLRDPVALLRARDAPTRLAAFWHYGDPDAAPPYSELMAHSSAMVADQLLAAWPFRRGATMLDIAGGSGAFAMAVARHAPALRVTVFDLPPVAAIAQARIAAAGLAGRVRAVGGDLLGGAALPPAPLATLVRVLHDHDDADAMRILRAARAAIAPGGTLLVAEPMAGQRRPLTATDAYFGFYLLAMGRGRVRTPRTLRRMARAAGFSRTRLVPTAVPLLLRVLACS